MAKIALPVRWVWKTATWGACFLTILLSSLSRAQDFSWSIKLQSGEEFPHVALQSINKDTLYFSNQSRFVDWVSVDSLSKLRRERRSAILPASLMGAVGGGAIGYALKPTARDQGEANVYSALFGVVIGGVAGYFVGSLIQPDQVLDFQQLDQHARIEVLRQELQER